MVDAARPSCRAIARKLSPSPLSAASRSLSSSLRCVPPDIAPSRIAIPGQSLTTRPRDVALHAGLRHRLEAGQQIAELEAGRLDNPLDVEASRAAIRRDAARANLERLIRFLNSPALAA